MLRFIGLILALVLAGCTATARQAPQPAVDNFDRAANAETTIALLGATGMVGGYLLDEALERGYQVRALARTPAKLATYAERITVVQGDARDGVAIDDLLAGADVVMSALGPVRGDGKAAQMLNTTATGHIIEAMQQRGIQRYILVSGAAVTTTGDDRDLLGWLVKQSAAITLRSALEDKQAEFELLEATSLAWTAVRCPVIRDEAYAGAVPIASMGSPRAFSVSAGELVYFMLEQIDSREFFAAGPFLASP